MPSFEEFVGHCEVVSAGGAEVYLPKATARAPKNPLSTRETELLTRSFGRVYAGEIPLHLFSKKKPMIRDFLSPPEVGERFALSPAACRGVLARDKTRGRKMPERLRAALEAVARNGEAQSI
jgi:hypothetical protein